MTHTRGPRPWQVVGGLLLIIVLIQLMTIWLGARRPAEPVILFTGLAALADPRADAWARRRRRRDPSVL